MRGEDSDDSNCVHFQNEIVNSKNQWRVSGNKTFKLSFFFLE